MKTGPSYRYKLKGTKPRRKTSHDVFDNTIQKTQVWLNDLMSELDWETTRTKPIWLCDGASCVAGSVHGGGGHSVRCSTPMLIRGFYYEGWTLKGKPHKERHKEDFLDHIKKAFKDDVTVNPNQVCRAVFRVLVKHTSKGEIEDVKHVLPKALHELWP